MCAGVALSIYGARDMHRFIERTHGPVENMLWTWLDNNHFNTLTAVALRSKGRVKGRTKQR